MIYLLEVNFYLALFYGLYFIAKKFLDRNQKNDLLGNFIFCLPLIFLFPIIADRIPVEVPMPPVIQKAVNNGVVRAYQSVPSNINIATASDTQATKLWETEEIITFFFLIGFLFWVVRFLISLVALKKVVNRSTVLKEYGNVKVLVGENIKSPCSFWLGKAYILIPYDLLSRNQSLKVVLAHELQHHRQGDTKFLYLLELIRGIFFLNPFAHLWLKEINLYQEIRCDQNVIKRKNYSTKSYMHALYEVIQMNSGVVPVGTLAMASFNDLSRRINMITRSNGSRGLTKRMTFLAISLLFVWQTACATRLNMNLTKLSISEAQDLVSSIESNFPIEVNETILKWLNYYMGDPKGRAFLLQTRSNMVQYETVLRDLLKEKKMPEELLAVPFMESGYKNDSLSIVGARGLWQFIPSTARHFGLKVSKKLDERLDVKKSTLAAIQYYKSLLKIKKFSGDWRLALLAYNTGEGALGKAIEARGTTDPWAFNDLGDEEYLAKVMAGVILLKSSKKDS